MFAGQAALTINKRNRPGHIGHVMFTMLSRHLAWIDNIGQDVFTSISVSQACPSSNALFLHTTTLQCRMWVTLIGHILLIAQLTLNMDCLHLLLLDHIDQSSSGMDCPHRPRPTNNVHETSSVAWTIAIGLHNSHVTCV